jgi:nucleoside-diphosphate-sugar epimerase
MKKVLITGASGFLGSHLHKRLVQSGSIVYSLKSRLTDYEELTKEITSLGQIDCCFHFAGISFVPDCEKNISLAYAVNTAGVVALAEMLAKTSPKLHFIFPSSAQLYDYKYPAVKISEKANLAPLSTYSRAKYLAERGLQTLAEQKGIYVTVLRLFNHSHKSQNKSFLLPSVYQQILSAQNKRDKKIVVGDLSLVRDIGAIQDLVDAFEKVYQSDPSVSAIGVNNFEVYNICSQVGKKLQDIVNEIIARSSSEVSIEIDSSLFRIGEPQNICGDATKFMSVFNWSPKRALTVSDLVTSFLKDVE